MKFIPAADVKMDDPFWSKRFTLVRDVVLPYMWEILNDRVENAVKSHCIANFKIAAGQSDEAFHGPVFIDTDLYKWIEAVSYLLSAEKNVELENLCDQAIDLVACAQQADGYLDTYYTIKEPGKRWTNLMEGHELYCAGHLIEAGVAYFQATGKDQLLNVARRFADLIAETFGEGKRRGYPGHPEIELALVRLYETTHAEKYLALAKYFIDERGTGEYLFENECRREGHRFVFPEMMYFKADYFQAQLPVRQQTQASGHAVRAMYLYSAMADLARLTHDDELAAACERLFDDTTTRQMYVTGGVGATKRGERFTTDFDLPSDSGYSETCASIGLMFFAQRMWLLNGKKGYYDIWEQALNNAVLSGMGHDGTHFFYVNPLEVVPQTVQHNPTLAHIKTQRQKWFGVACCPPNLARILTSMRGSLYALDNDRLYILSHIGSSFEQGGLYVKLMRQGNEYTLTIEGTAREIYLRLPENSTLVGDRYEKREDGYFVIHHAGGKQQYVYTLQPSIRVLHAHPSISALTGKVCVQRGLTTYCVEGIDNSEPLSTLRLPADAVFTEEKADWLEDDLPVLRTAAFSVSQKDWEHTLYRSQPGVYESKEITLIPYSQWGNRGEHEMRVWLTEK